VVTQPAYLKILKDYARERHGDEEDLRSAVLDMKGESDRGAIILSATSIEDVLELEIANKMPSLKNDDQLRKRIFEGDGPISSFSRKIDMAYALGIIDKQYHGIINLIREVRNACAHARRPISLARPELQGVCKVIISDTINDIPDNDPQSLRDALLIKCMLVGHYILSGEKIEGTQAIINHYKKLTAEAAAEN
jgi:hypothetical protein